MNNPPLIGITCGTSATDPAARNPQDRLNCAYSRAIWLAGGLPVILPNLDDDCFPERALSRLDGLLLSGGDDVAPAAYGQIALNDTVEVDAARDRAELPLIRAALDADLPLLAICRGIQSLNVALGGTLIQDLPAQRPSSIQHTQSGARTDMTHTVSIEAGTSLARICGSGRFAVNSFHHQAVDSAAAALRVTAYAEDGVVEAAEIPGARFVIAVQWHPEELLDVSEEAARIFGAFVEACSDGL